ncbi:hypothetical protein ACFWAP_03720 [Streptomyces goshikiensis]|uniref:hypothetical protein n=1 Tax=Streptomyces goshikiensis TaxID=1942 RepID=UPI00364FA6CB
MSKSSNSPAGAVYRAARDGVRATASSAAHVAALYLIEANGGSGTVRKSWKGEGPDAWCEMAAPGFTAYLLDDSFGDRAHLAFYPLNEASYEELSGWFQGRTDCPHDEECQCHPQPWPAVASLADGGEHDICFLDGELRGTAYWKGESIVLDLFEEHVEEAAELLRALRAG